MGYLHKLFFSAIMIGLFIYRARRLSQHVVDIKFRWLTM
jgi:hypothetical protein